MSKGTGNVAKSVKADRFAVTYEDDTGDTINLSDDEDLLAAYDVAENHILNKQLKLKIVPREGEEETQTLDKPIQEEIKEPMMKMNLQDSIPKKAFKEEMQIDSNSIQNAIKETMNGGKTEDESSEDSDSDTDNQKRNKKGKKMFGNMPKKAFRKMIRKEMNKQFTGIMDQKQSVPQNP